jgi:hypothetical protein
MQISLSKTSSVLRSRVARSTSTTRSQQVEDTKEAASTEVVQAISEIIEEVLKRRGATLLTTSS